MGVLGCASIFGGSSYSEEENYGLQELKVGHGLLDLGKKIDVPIYHLDIHI